MEFLKQLNKLLQQPNSIVRNYEVLLKLMKEFTDNFEDPTLLFGDSDVVDDLKPIMSNLLRKNENLTSTIPIELELLGARIIKILLRKPINRTNFGKYGISAIIHALKRQVNDRTVASVEICNIILNCCYEGSNVNLYIDEGGLEPLVLLLKSTRDIRLQSSALGALQGICFVPLGRQTVRFDTELLRLLSSYLQSDDDLVRARCTGTVHNLSVDIGAIKFLREADCLQFLVTLLKDPSIEICQAAVSSLQNISRETLSRQLLIDYNVVPILSELVCSNDVHCQVAASGALLNILGENLSEAQRHDLKCTLTDGIVLGCIKGCLFEN